MSWTLWKALIELTVKSKSGTKEWENPIQVIKNVLDDFQKNYNPLL